MQNCVGRSLSIVRTQLPPNFSPSPLSRRLNLSPLCLSTVLVSVSVHENLFSVLFWLEANAACRQNVPQLLTDSLTEISPNNRAICRDTVCKKASEKIVKGTIRFGTWTEINEHGSWHWKHWYRHPSEARLSNQPC